MCRPKNFSHKIHVYLEGAAHDLLRAEVNRLSTKPGKLLSRMIKERAQTFFSRPVQLIDK
jgi:hypothetical protein